jgi:hypothetical protein
MSEIQRLLQVAASRNAATEYGGIRFRLLKSLAEAMRAQLRADGLSQNNLFEAVVRGYVERHPAVLAMIDQWKRDEGIADEPVKPLSSREVDDIYAALGSGMMEEEEP